MARTADQLRKSELAQIHLGKKHLERTQPGFDDGAYRDMLFAIARVRSAADLDWAGRKRVIDHLKANGAKLGRHAGQPKPATPDRTALLEKIGAQLADMKLPWAYAHGMAKHMFKVEKLDWCEPQQLSKIVAALTYKQVKAKGGEQ